MNQQYQVETTQAAHSETLQNVKYCNHNGENDFIEHTI